MKLILIIILVILINLFSEEGLSTIDIHDAWEKYPSAGIQNNSTNKIKMPENSDLKSLHERVLDHVKDQRIEQLKPMIAEIYSNEISYRKYISAGILYSKNNLFTLAISEFEKAQAVAPDNHTIYNNMANVYYLSGDLNKAISLYYTSLQIKKNNPSTLLNLSFLLYEKGEYDKARENYYMAILINPALDKKQYKEIAESRKK